MKINFNNKNILIGYYFIFVSMLVLIALIKPSLNWDMIGYVASVKNFEINNPVELHNFVFHNLKEFVSPDMYILLTDSDSQYRIDMATNANLFYQQLPFYEIRIAYTFCIYLMTKIGLNIFFSTYLVSIISSVLGVVFLFNALKDKIYIGFLYALPLFLMFAGIINLTRLSTPDSMAFLCLSIFVYLFSNKKIIFLLAIMPLFVLVRTDMIIFNLLVFFVIFVIYSNHRKSVYISLLATILFYLSINSVFNNYGWATIFSVTLVERISNPADVMLSISVGEYLKAFLHGIIGMLGDRVFLGFFSITCAFLLIIKKIQFSFQENKEIFIYGFISILYIFIHFILFPVVWDRFFIGFYTMIIVSIMLFISKIITKNDPSPL
ncbi:MAG: hypothetical protein JJV95_00260 [Sulfurospirillum sp.]|nr:hypothetical protein [Sulfurospirillum sp.]MBL0702399.1 hypothetical protein [Sulfurospirillum sp.]